MVVAIVVMTVAALVGAYGGPSGTAQARRGGFVSVRAPNPNRAPQAVTISSSKTGRVLQVLISDPYHGMQVDSTSLDRSGHVWVTLTSGPRCRTPGLSSCGGEPRSCRGEVVRVTPWTGRVQTVLTAPDDQLIGDGQPSPDGRFLAYQDGTCNRAYSNQHLVVRNLDTGQSWNIGNALPPCHVLYGITWTGNGRQLAVVYGASVVTASTAERFHVSATDWGDGFCAESKRNGLAVIDARRSQPGLVGSFLHADPDCQISSATATTAGYAAVETCGGVREEYSTGPIRLLLLSPKLQIVSRRKLGACTGGTEIAAGPGHKVLIAAQQGWCHPSRDRMVLTVVHGASAKAILDLPVGGYDDNEIQSISW